MHLLALQFLNVVQPVIFKFNNLKTAKAEFENVCQAFGPSNENLPSFLLMEDDYGHIRAFWGSQVQNAALIDAERDIASQAELAVLQQRGQAQANRMAQMDPTLRLATMQASPIFQG
jgi:hypothetical protein